MDRVTRMHSDAWGESTDEIWVIDIRIGGNDVKLGGMRAAPSGMRGRHAMRRRGSGMKLTGPPARRATPTGVWVRGR